MGCITTSQYKSADTNAYTEWDIRKGKTVGGKVGEIAFYKNMANTTTFNRTSGTGALAGVDIYDTIRDYNDGGAFPTQNPTGWFQANGGNWIMDPTLDVGGGVAGDGICSGTEVCIYIDRITGMKWAKTVSGSYTWEQAITYCENLTLGGYTTWRLPTEKDFHQAYVDGIWTLAIKLNLPGVYIWAATTDPATTTRAVKISIEEGESD